MSLMISLNSTNVDLPSIHEFKIQKLNSDELLDFSSFEGKKILIVNVASKCGYTYQYADLEKLYQKYNDQLVIIGVPSNQFLSQEPGSDEKIANFCTLNYGVTFPMTTKVKVKGKLKHPVYKWLTEKKNNGVGDYQVGWNFNKFILNEKGQLLEHFSRKVEPFDEAILKYLD